MAGSGIDLESSGEFASVEKMLATTDTNKFSTYLQTGDAELAKRGEAAPGPIRYRQMELRLTQILPQQMWTELQPQERRRREERVRRGSQLLRLLWRPLRYLRQKERKTPTPTRSRR